MPPFNSVQQHPDSERLLNGLAIALESCPSVCHVLLLRAVPWHSPANTAGFIPAQRRHEREQELNSLPSLCHQTSNGAPPPPSFKRTALPKLDWSSSTMCPRQAAHCIFGTTDVKRQVPWTRTCKQADLRLRVIDPSPRRGCMYWQMDQSLLAYLHANRYRQNSPNGLLRPCGSMASGVAIQWPSSPRGGIVPVAVGRIILTNTQVPVCANGWIIRSPYPVCYC